MWLRQMAQLSTTMSHAQRATAFHYMNVSATQSIQCLAYVQANSYLLDLKLLLSLGDIAACTSFGVLVDFGRSARIGHLDVGHGGCGVLGAWFVERRVARVVMEAKGRV